MTIKEIQTKFRNQDKARQYLENLKWPNKVTCDFCNSDKTIYVVSEKRHKCYTCKKSFSVTTGTIFENTKWALIDWFTVIGLMLNAKLGASAMELHRNLGCSYKTAWYASMRIRCAMIDDNIELSNIVEMDEAYVGGKPRKRTPENKANLSTVSTNKRGRGTSKIPVVGIVERNGKVVLHVTEKITSKFLISMLKDSVDIDNTIVMTDEFPAYKKFDKIVEHLTINHKKEFARGIVHTNTIEGFWAIVKNSIRGNYIVLSRKYLPLYLVQAQYIYNRRNSKHSLFEEFMKRALTDEKVLLNYKPVKPVTKIVYK